MGCSVSSIGSMTGGFALAVLSFYPALALDRAPAGDAGCACLTALSGHGRGIVQSASGELSILGDHGFTPVKTGAELAPGARVFAGQSGSAILSFGAGCQVRLGPDSDADISVTGQKVCVRLSKSGGVPDVFKAQVPAGDVQVGFQQFASPTPAQVAKSASDLSNQIDRTLADLAKRIAQAKTSGDVVKVTAYNDLKNKLNQLKTDIKNNKLINNPDEGILSHEQAVLQEFRQRLAQIKIEINHVVGEDVVYTGQTQVTTDVDPVLPPEDPTAPPITPTPPPPPPTDGLPLSPGLPIVIGAVTVVAAVVANNNNNHQPPPMSP